MNQHTDQTTVVYHLLRDIGKVMRLFQSEAVLCEGITFAQFCILDHTAAHGGRLGMSELHGLLSVEKSTTTRLVGPLANRGLVVKIQSEHDSRAIDLELTAEGRDIHQKVWGCITGFIEDVLQRIPKDRRDNVLDGLGEFIRSIRQCCGGTTGGECNYG